MFNNKFTTLLIIITLVLFGGGVVFLSKTGSSEADNSQTATDANTKAVVEETSYDWGEIGINDGNVEKVFNIKNEGTGTLKLFNVVTSCMCTTAQLSLGDTKSPLFGMHTKSKYVLEVPSGQTAQLKVIFDPAFHGPSGIGPITRQIEVETNDPSTPQLSFMLTAVVRK